MSYPPGPPQGHQGNSGYSNSGYPNPGYPYHSGYDAEGRKSFLATWLLSWFLGILGIDRFYLGKIGTGVLKLITVGGVGIWALIDIIIILCGAMRDKDGYRLAGYEQHKTVAWIVSIVLFLFGIGGGLLSS